MKHVYWTSTVGLKEGEKMKGSDGATYVWSNQFGWVRELPDPGPREPAAAPFTGWRCWRVFDTSLGSMGLAHTWGPGINEAVHLPEKCHAGPASGCACGFWAYKTRELLMENFPTFMLWGQGIPVCYGQVEMWGHVIEHKLGFRAQYVRPVGTLMLSRGTAMVGVEQLIPLAQRIAERYNVSVELMDPSHVV